MGTPGNKTGNPEQLWQGETDRGEIVTLTTAPMLGNGVVLATRVKNSESRWFSVYLDNEILGALGGTLIGYNLRLLIESFGGTDAEEVVEPDDSAGDTKED